MKLGLHTITAWFGIIMIILVISGAVLLTFTDLMSDKLFGTKRTVFIFILIAYGVYRSFRLYHLFKHLKNE
jgi:uncharacterized membrane protein (DUF373 family)